MRRLALLAVVTGIAGCGGGGDKQDAVHKSVEAAAKRLHQRLEQEAAKKDPVDQALLQIEKSDMPADVKQQLFEAKELLDKYGKK